MASCRVTEMAAYAPLQRSGNLFSLVDGTCMSPVRSVRVREGANGGLALLFFPFAGGRGQGVSHFHLVIVVSYFPSALQQPGATCSAFQEV